MNPQASERRGIGFTADLKEGKWIPSAGEIRAVSLNEELERPRAWVSSVTRAQTKWPSVLASRDHPRATPRSKQGLGAHLPLCPF
jgi:hypothetical protein